MPQYPLLSDAYVQVQQFWSCRIHGKTRATLQISFWNEQGELVFKRNYCIQCYDRFLQNNLEPLPEWKDED